MSHPAWPQLLPDDPHDHKLQANVHPHDWQNPSPRQPCQLVVLGAGTAGLVTAAAAAGLGARVALVERELMGGDCLNVGCVPSKGLIAAARMAASVRDAADFGVHLPTEPIIDFARAMQRMREKRARISPVDSARRFQELGVDVYFGEASFLDERTVTVTSGHGEVLSLPFRKAVIATGARAAAPPVPGLESIDYLTNETLFSLTALPRRFGVIGGGPVGSEMAQSFARLGSEVSLFEQADHILPREPADAAALVENQFERDGVKIYTGLQELQVGPHENGTVRVSAKQQSGTREIVVDRLLVAAGRAPNTGGLNLDAVQVGYDDRGVHVDEYQRTTNPRIYAAGDICSPLKFTHAADFQARIVIQNALFAIGPFGRKKASDLVIPWTTYTSPEVAHVGMYEAEAREAGIEVDTWMQPLEHVDRAILDGRDDGFVRILTKRRTDRIVGATVVAENAGDLICEIVVAMTNRIGLQGLGASIHPYPTVADAIRRLGDQYSRSRLTPFNQRLLNFLKRLNVGR
jgi:pyruvate/2-oxoglutarate dehydrogenase complex dihydrolipoamide dehydrogenase (E3) component